MTGDRYSISVEGRVVSHPPSLISGFAAAFALYYVFGLAYPVKSQCTLELIQRYRLLHLSTVYFI